MILLGGLWILPFINISITLREGERTGELKVGFMIGLLSSR
jgi:hypothetical protein